MDEKTEQNTKEGQEKTEDERETKPSEDNGNEETSFVKDAKAAAAEIKEQNEKREKLLEEERKILDRKEALNALGGGSPAGNSMNQKAETPEEFAKKLQAGDVHMDDFLSTKNE